MIVNNQYPFISFILAAVLLVIPLSGHGQCSKLELQKVIENDDSEIPDSIILCLLAKNQTTTDPLQLAEFLGKRHFQCYNNNEYEHALQFAQYQAQVWNALDSLVKYNNSLYRQGLCYYRLGNMFDSHRVVTQSIEYAKRIDDLYNYTVGHSRLAWIYARLDQYQEAIAAIKIYKENGAKVYDNRNYLRFYHNAMSNFNYRIQAYEIARMHVDSAIQIVLEGGDREDYATYISNKSNYFEGKDSLEQRLAMLRTSYAINKQFDNKINLSENYLNFGTLFLLQNEYDSSLYYLNKGLKLFDEIDNKSRTHEALGLLAEVYDSIGYFQHAYEAKKKQFTLDNELYGLAEVGKLFDLEKKLSIQKADEKIVALENEKKLKSIQIQRQRANLIAMALAFMTLIVLWFFYNYRKKQKRKFTQLLKEQQRHREKVLLEKKALSAQMNPHFLFNSLNSIKSFIANREPRIATRYLNKFAQLMRITLSFSEEKLITLSEEIKAVKLYTELEQFRLQDSFECHFDIEVNLDTNSIYVPPLIIQPFVENAIWHGLVKKEGQKQLKVTIAQKKDRLLITIADNGIGRKASEKTRIKSHKSLGMKITKDRLALFEGANEVKRENVQINDLVQSNGEAAGTIVTLNLKINKSSDEKI